MKWRCEWCGKPHESDDPPCDTCGHGSFERAVVQAPDSSTDGPQTTTVWVCTNCDREHAKHSPPCSRCGNATLEREEKSVPDEELTPPGYRELLSPQYLIILLAVVGLGAFLLLGATGIVDVPGFPDSSEPTVEDVPGNATGTGNISFATVESSFLTALNERRVNAGNGTLERLDVLDEGATFYNQRTLAAVFDDADRPTDSDLLAFIGDECSKATVVSLTHSLDTGSDSETLGQTVASRLENGSPVLGNENDTIGLDIHSFRDTLYIVQVVC